MQVNANYISEHYGGEQDSQAVLLAMRLVNDVTKKKLSKTDVRIAIHTFLDEMAKQGIVNKYLWAVVSETLFKIPRVGDVIARSADGMSVTVRTRKAAQR
jgi:hypothetical protein